MAPHVLLRTFARRSTTKQWRDFIRKLRDCNVNHDPSGYRGAASIRSLGQQLYQGLVGLSPALREFLGRDGVARRLVIQRLGQSCICCPGAH